MQLCYGVVPLTAAIAAMPFVTSVRVAEDWLLAGLTVKGGAGPNVLANLATALVTADDVSSCPLLSAAGSFRLSAGARPSANNNNSLNWNLKLSYIITFHNILIIP